jgi:hypothetical protein
MPFLIKSERLVALILVGRDNVLTAGAWAARQELENIVFSVSGPAASGKPLREFT